MNARIINLRTRRKQKARADKAAQGTANAVKFGRNKAEKSKQQALEDRAVQYLDGHKLDDSATDNDD